MEMHKIHSMQRYQQEQIHLDRSSAYEGGLPSRTTSASLQQKKQKNTNEQDHRFQDLLDEMLEDSDHH